MGRELESLNPYPVEILPGKHYIGEYRQATNLLILKDLKLNALVNIQQCKANTRPNRGFVQQLSDWELQTLGKRVTDISEPNY
ncbi:serine/threonine/tyrosine-interacting-like protein 1 [Carassius carassius]|uniref:serine/threonine/tyrosine-interacting-like protein 1 n=1 Tax=Carassius carassius TaxID=217509 RepID=UPI002868A12C|nr:serine/threonine/tyrosine-interacting-like protein 1 [Carassius carassius]